MTIYEKALKDIYAAYNRLMQDRNQESVANLLAAIAVHRDITGDPSAPNPVGLIHGKSPIETALNDVDVAQRAMKELA